ncbi:MAG: choice-of-anchor A family protein [Phenylobacterium sp.]|uniref:choice-of-anchor A family protein n=1 Tax=Phenylobacterium sp. TaxID=1871053 RepID=UPI001A58EA49|nr:choice-of-anchor A family protein [Phenylobacterium sp.]MBL8771114.1 choice-of-anchor A family protein [Phenylobacterium sp.]
MRKLTVVAALAAAVLTTTSAAAETAADFNLFVLENFRAVGSDEEGRVAVGGDFYARHHSVGLLADPGDVNLVVGGNLDARSGSAYGKTIVGGSVSTDASWAPSNILPGGTPSPVDFAAEAQRLRDLSDILAGYAATGTTSYQFCGACQITLTGGLSGLNVFTVDGARLATTNTFNIVLPSDGYALINVTGSTGKFANSGMFFNGQFIDLAHQNLGSRLFWNYAEATTLDFRGIAMAGSVLAPDADYVGGPGVVFGQMVVKSFGGADWNVTQINNVRDGTGLFNSPPGAVPEPATWALMIAGFGLAGAALRRRYAAFAR